MFKKKDKTPKDGEAEEAKEEGAAEAKPEGEAAEGEEGAEAAPKKGKRKLIIIAAVVLLAVVGGVAAMLLGGGDKKEGDAAHGEAHGDGHGEEVKLDEHGNPLPPAGPTYYELPEFLVNLNSPSGRVSFLKMSVTLQLKNQEAVAALDANKPRILDTFNTYLRELRPADVQGSAGIYRLRGELMTRLNATIEEGIVKDILFSEIIVQ